MGNAFGVLGGNHHRGDPDGAVVAILHGDLRFGVRAEPGGLAALADPAQFAPEAVGEHYGGGHQLRGFTAGVAEHQALVTGALLRGLFAVGLLGVDTLGDIRALAGEGIHDVDLVGVKDIVFVDIADLADGATDEGVVVELGPGGDFPGDDHQV